MIRAARPFPASSVTEISGVRKRIHERSKRPGSRRKMNAVKGGSDTGKEKGMGIARHVRQGNLSHAARGKIPVMAGEKEGKNVPVVAMGEAYAEEGRDFRRKEALMRYKANWQAEKLAEPEKEGGMPKSLKVALVRKIVKKMIGDFSLIGIFIILLLVVFVAMTSPILVTTSVIYNSPLALFFPPLEDGDTVISVANEDVQSITRNAFTQANNHFGCDFGEVRFVNSAGTSDARENLNDVMAVYMVKYGVGEMATVVNDQARDRIRQIVNDMCRVSVTTEENSVIEQIDNGDGTYTEISVTKKTKVVTVLRKTWLDMISEYGFSGDQVTLLREVMNSEYLDSIDYAGDAFLSFQGDLDQDRVNEILSAVPHGNARNACAYALSKVGLPYDEARRFSGAAFDDGSLAYFAWDAAGVDISFEGRTDPVSEARGLFEKGYVTNLSDVRPGDLIFWSRGENGQFREVDHVGIYVGDGCLVEAVNESTGIIYGRLQDVGNIVMVGRPRTGEGG